MRRTACTEPQCLYSIAIPLLPLCVVRPVQSISACTRVHFTYYRVSQDHIPHQYNDGSHYKVLCSLLLLPLS